MTANSHTACLEDRCCVKKTLHFPWFSVTISPIKAPFCNQICNPDTPNAQKVHDDMGTR